MFCTAAGCLCRPPPFSKAGGLAAPAARPFVCSPAKGGDFLPGFLSDALSFLFMLSVGIAPYLAVIAPGFVLVWFASSLFDYLKTPKEDTALRAAKKAALKAPSIALACVCVVVAFTAWLFTQLIAGM